jgi:hypothetical protein
VRGGDSLPVSFMLTRSTTLPRSRSTPAAVLLLHLQVHHPTRGHSQTAEALQEALPSVLTSTMPGQLVHLSSAWVRGCVQMFIWAAHYRHHLAAAHRQRRLSNSSDHSSDGAQQAAATTQAQWQADEEVAISRSNSTLLQNLQAATAINASLMQARLLRAAEAAGAQGAVDVQVGTDQPPSGHHPDQTQEPALPSSITKIVGLAHDDADDVIAARMSVSSASGSSVSGPTPTPTITASTASIPMSTNGRGTSSPVTLHHISPPCLTLPTAGTSSHPPLSLHVHLHSQQTQRVRLLVLAGAEGVAVVDTEHTVAGGGSWGSPVTLSIPSKGLASLAHDSRTGVILLRLVITSAALAVGSSHESQPMHLHATATLVAAPKPLASELLALYSLMEVQGKEEGLDSGEVWSGHWQPLMDDLTSCLYQQGSSASVAVPDGAPGTTVTVEREALSNDALAQVLSGLREFFSTHAMSGWLQQLQHLSGCPGGGQDTAGAGRGEGPSSASGDHLTETLRTSCGAACAPADPAGQPPGASVPTPTSASSSSPARKQPNEHQQPLTAPALRPKPLALACSLGLGGCLHLLVSGFPDAQQESEWQRRRSMTPLGSTPPLGLMFDAASAAAAVIRMWQAGWLSRWSDTCNLIPMASSTFVRACAHLRCALFTRGGPGGSCCLCWMPPVVGSTHMRHQDPPGPQFTSAAAGANRQRHSYLFRRNRKVYDR